MEFKSTAQKITETRKKLGLRQIDFETENFTRAYLGLIEGGKRKATDYAIEIIINRMRKRAEELNIDIDLSKEYFLKTPKEEAYAYCSHEVENRDKLRQEKLYELIGICKEYQFKNLLIILYDEMGKIHLHNNEYDNAYVFLKDAYELIDDNTENEYIVRVNARLGIYYQDNLNYESALRHYNAAYKVALKDEKLNNYIRYVKFNMALCYKGLGEYKKAIDTMYSVEALYDKYNERDLYIDKATFIANCYIQLKQYDEAGKIYNKLVNFIKYGDEKQKMQLKNINERLSLEDKNQLARIYTNIACLLIEGSNKDVMAMDYLRKAEEIRKNIDEKCLNHTIIEKAKIFMNYKKYDEAIKESKRCIELSREHKDNKYIMEGYCMMLACYRKKEEYGDEVKALIKELVQFLTSLKKYKEAIAFLVYLEEIYLKENNIEMMKKCTEEAEVILSMTGIGKEVITSYLG